MSGMIHSVTLALNWVQRVFLWCHWSRCACANWKKNLSTVDSSNQIHGLFTKNDTIANNTKNYFRFSGDFYSYIKNPREVVVEAKIWTFGVWLNNSIGMNLQTYQYSDSESKSTIVFNNTGGLDASKSATQNLWSENIETGVEMSLLIFTIDIWDSKVSDNSASADFFYFQ